jgi:tripartite-type tricarboxylate transporter receptor subunit TctC
MTTTIRYISSAALAVLAAALSSPSYAQDPSTRARQSRSLSDRTRSGGYDTYGRLLARHMGKHLAGNPSFVVQNMPGAGGLRSANHLYNVAPRDGTVIGIFDQAAFLDQLLGSTALRGDIRNLNWIGRMVGNSAVLFAWHTAKSKRLPMR